MISSFVSWNGFPNYIWKALLYRLKSSSSSRSKSISKNDAKDKMLQKSFSAYNAKAQKAQKVKHCLKKIGSCIRLM